MKIVFCHSTSRISKKRISLDQPFGVLPAERARGGRRRLALRAFSAAFLVLFLLQTNLLFAQVATTDVSPDFPYGASLTNLDGRIPGMVLDSNNSSIVYAAGEWSGIWKSVDGAHSWQFASTGLRNGITQEDAYPNLAIDSTNTQRLLYATTSKDGRADCEGCQFGGLWVSVNAAANWQHVSLCASEKSADNISSVVFSSGRPFVATACGVWTTSDPQLLTGWNVLTLPRGVSPGGSIFAPNVGGQTLIACLGGGTSVYRSTNLGQSWGGGVNVGGTCKGIAVPPYYGQSQPSISVVVRSTSTARATKGPGSAKLEITVVNHDTVTTQDLGFAGVAQGGSGRPGVWVAPRNSPAAFGPGVAYDVFAADSFLFYKYSPPNGWSKPFSTHVDTWWMEFPNYYDGAVGVCPAFTANDGGIFSNDSTFCSFAFFGDASSGLHVAWGNHISGMSLGSNNAPAALCAIANNRQPCPTVFDPTTDDDTFIREAPPNVWSNFPDGLGDAGEVLFDPLLPNVVLAVRNGTYNLFVGPSGELPLPGTSYYNLAPGGTDFYTGIQAPTAEAVKVVLTTPNETPLKNGDFLALQSPFSTNLNHCVQNHNCGNDVIVRNLSAALGQDIGVSAWFDISPQAQFGPGQVSGIYPSGGHSTTVYVLTSNAPGVNYANTPYKPGQVYKALSQVIGEPITSWQPASGSGANSLVQAYNLWVNPYNPNELWAIDLGSSPSAIKVSRDGGQTWTAVQTLKDIATNYGEFNFTCGAFANGPSNYQDKEIFGNECSMTEMLFPPGQPQVRFAILYPGGIAFSGDGGNTWTPLNATNANASQQPIELPQSAFYDPTTNGMGNSSLFVALEGRGVKRIDAPFAALGSGQSALQTFALADSTHVLTLGTDTKLWLDPAPFGTVPNPNRMEVDANVAGIQVINGDQFLVLGTNGNLWLEPAPFGQVPNPARTEVDGNVANFQALFAGFIFVLGKDGNLWWEYGPFGKVPPQRQQVDGNVGSFQAVDLNHVFVLGTNGNLWLEQPPYGKVPPSRKQVDGDVQSFQTIDANDVLVLGRNGNLWLEQAPFGDVPPSRQLVDANVRAFHPVGTSAAYVLGTNGNLWFEQAPFGKLPPARQQVDGNVGSFEAIDSNDVLVLGQNGNLWWEHGPYGKLPPGRQQVDGNVQTPSAGY